VGDLAALLAGGTAVPFSSGTLHTWDINTFLDVYHVGKTENNKKREIGLGLVWDKTDGYAHGAFNMATEFTLDAPLADNGSGGKGLDGAWSWDGRTLTKIGADRLILAGDNTYTGNTTVSAGTPEVAGTLDSDGNADIDYVYTGTIASSGTLHRADIPVSSFRNSMEEPPAMNAASLHPARQQGEPG
jgi:autotransporter-associated beta strand protein